MPWYMGCCCIDVWMARNLIRYQNRIKGNDMVEECVLPYGLQILGNVLGSVIPCAMCFVYAGYVVLSMQLLEETQRRAVEQEAAGDRDMRSPVRRQRQQPGGYSMLGSDFSPHQGEFYLSSPPPVLPSAPVAGQLMHVVGGAREREVQMMPTVVQNPAHARATSVQPGSVVFNPSHMNAVQAQAF
jgi:hypothetical protein